MAEDFPDDSLFKNSNVAFLDAAYLNNINERTSRPREVGKAVISHSEKDSIILKFTTAKEVLNSKKRGNFEISSSTCVKKDINTNDETAPDSSNLFNFNLLKLEGKDQEKDVLRHRNEEPSVKIQKNKNELKDKVKTGYKPLNIARNVSCFVKSSGDSSEDNTNTSGDKSKLGSNSLDAYHHSESNDSNSTIISTQEKLKLESWGFPPNILHQYAKRGISSMFPWQVECLCCPRVLNGGNLVYSAPTSAGKTLVAEILCIKTILERRKKALFILPFISVVREKMFYFQELLRGSGIRVDGFMGGHSPPGGFRTIDLAVCTIEKANSLINRLMEEGGLADLGAVIVDELHLVGDSHRGYLLELLLTKLKFMSLKDSSVCIQIVGMSATLPNLSLLSNWLDADLYRTSFRPIPLEEYVKIGSGIYNKSMQPVRTVQPEFEIKNDADNIVYLCLETIADGHSVLIFCPTKSWCESLAQTVAAQFRSIGLNRDINAPESLPYKLREQLNSTAIAQALEQLQRCPVGLDSILKKVISFGVAFHHAGLTMDERDIVEGCFRNGTLRVLVATSTLSSGVNLPARRVIIRTPMFHGRPVDVLAYQQMVGRAGRMGVDTAGESFLVCQSVEKRIAENVVGGHLSSLQSCLGRGSLSASLKRAILEVIASKVVTSPQDVELYANCTLLAAGFKEKRSASGYSLFNPSDNNNPISSCLDFLRDNEFIRLQADDEGVVHYTPTPLGQACLSASLSPDEGLLLFKELERARQCFVLENELHILYQVTPFNVAEQWGNLDWLQVLALWEQLPTDLKRVGELVGVEDRFIVRVMRGTINVNSEKQKMKFMIHRRFYASLALHDLVNEIPLNVVASKFNCSRGVLQSLQQSASTYAGMVTSFCHRLGWSSVELLIDQFQDRLHFGAHRDLLDLLRLPSLNGPRARALYNAGITNIMELTTADVLAVENALHSAVPFISDKERDGETAFDADHRRKLKNVWITGRQGLSEREAAELIIEEARNAVQIELGVQSINWEKAKRKEKSSEVSATDDRKTSSSFFNESTDLKSAIVSDPGENTKSALSSLGDEILDFKPSLVFNKQVCMDMSKKLSSKVKRIIESLDQKKGSGRIEDNGNLKNSVENTAVEINCQGTEEKNFHNSGIESGSQENNQDNSSIQQLSKTNSNISSICSKEINITGNVFNIDNGKKHRRASVEKLFDSSISNTALAGLDYHNFDISSKVSDLGSDLNNGHLESWCVNLANQDELTSATESKIDSSLSCKMNGSHIPHEKVGLDGKGEVHENRNMDSSSNHVQEPLQRRVSIDLFTVSPSQDLGTAVNLNTPSDTCSRIHSKLESSRLNQGLLSSPLLGDCPNGLVNDRSPSLFGDSFEIDCSALDVVDGSLVAGHAAKDENVKDISNGSQGVDSETTPKSVDSDTFIDVESIDSQRVLKNESNCSILNRSVESVENIICEKLDCDKSVSSLSSQCPKVHSFQKGPSLHLGVRRKPVKRKPLKENENTADSFLGTVFHSAYEFSNSVSSKRILNYSSEKSDNATQINTKNESSASQNLKHMCQDNGLNSDNHAAEDNKYLEESPRKKLKLTSSSADKDFMEDVIFSSQESIETYEKPLRKSNRAKSTSKHNLPVKKAKSSVPSKGKRNLRGQESNVIGLPLSRSTLLRRKAGMQSFDQKQTEFSDLVKTPIALECNTSNPFEITSTVDWTSFKIIDVCGNINLFKSFLQALPTVKTLSMSLACEKRMEETKSHSKIGSKIVTKKKDCAQEPPFQQNDMHKLMYENLALVGVSFCFGGANAYYVSFQVDTEDHNIPLIERLKVLKDVVGCNSLKPACTVCCFDFKEQLKVLYRCAGIASGCITAYDPKVADWLLEPEGKEKNLQAMVVAYLKEATGLVEQVGNVRGGVGSPALDIEQTIPARKRASLEAILGWNLAQVQHKIMADRGILHSFTQVEMPVILILAYMEINGITFDSSTAEALRNKLVSKLEDLQEQCYKLAGHSFSLTSPADVAQVIYKELQLKSDNIKKSKAKSTSKEALSRLRNSHPLPEIILLWRKINAVLVKTVSPLLHPEATNSILGQYIFHTATGRILMHEPNLQNIPRDFDISLHSPENFSMRAAFVPAQGNWFVAADYSQLELRLLAHLANDSKLRNILNSGEDVFCCIAASWNNIPKEQVTDRHRQSAKQICYGILYGMGVAALAEQLEVDESEASLLVEKFRSTYPGVRQFVSDTIEFCKKNGYVMTLLGRHRQLPAISSQNIHVRAHAERQAVNTTVQGSAADIVKTAMVHIEKALHKCGERNTVPRLVLHLHDELIYEVPQEMVSQFVKLLRSKMENAIPLSVQLPVKVKKGTSWGTLECI